MAAASKAKVKTADDLLEFIDDHLQQMKQDSIDPVLALHKRNSYPGNDGYRDAMDRVAAITAVEDLQRELLRITSA